MEKGWQAHLTARLDRYLISADWNDIFNNIKQTPLHRISSDHTPLSLKCGSCHQNKSYFKFENWWLQTGGFKERIKDWWTVVNCEGTPHFILAYKLKALKVKLKELSKIIQWILHLQKSNILNQLLEMEEIHDCRILTNEEVLIKKNSLYLEYEKISKSWRGGMEAKVSRPLVEKGGQKHKSFP